MNGIFQGKFDENTSSFMSLRGSKYIQNIFYMMRNENVNTLKGKGESHSCRHHWAAGAVSWWYVAGWDVSMVNGIFFYPLKSINFQIFV